MGERLSAADAQVEAQRGELQARSVEVQDARERIAELERVAERLSERVVERDRELRRMRADLGRLHDQSDREMRSLATVARELDQVRRQARGQATRIRMHALRDAAEMSERIAELARRPGEMRERLLESLTEAIARIGEEDGSDGEPALTVVQGNGRTADDVDQAVLFEGAVEVEIGPLSDFSKLVGFEDAARGVDATAEVSVKRFREGRATLEMKLGQPVALLHELEERAPFEFVVRDTRRDRLVLDVDENAGRRAA